MSLLSFIDINFLNPLQSIPYQWYYSARKKYKPLNQEKREHHIVVSLTSFPARFGSLHYAIKSILTQSMQPDVIFLCLAKDEIKDESALPSSILELKKYGLQIYFADENIKPHNKYYYAMKYYPDSIIITVDDDNMYDNTLIHDLYQSYLKYPNTVSARRVHKIIRDKNGILMPYSKWLYEHKKETAPSFDLLATGVGGVIYPQGILPAEAFDIQKIKKLCLNADDIWLKFMELKNNIPVVWVKGHRIHPLNLKKAQKITLQKNNYHGNMNDAYTNALQDYYCLKLAPNLNG